MLVVRKDRTLIGDAGAAKVQFYQISETDVHLMKTPGFDDTNNSDREILETMAKARVDAFKDEAEIQGALNVRPVTKARMKGSGMKNLRMFKKVLGTRRMARCQLVITKWSLQEEGYR